MGAEAGSADDRKGLGARLRDLRVRRGLSQTELAGPDISPSYISLVESGRRSPSTSVIAVLAQRLGVSATYLATGVEDDAQVHARADLALVRVSVEHGDHAEALSRGDDLAAQMGPHWDRSDELDLLRAQAHELAGDLEDTCRLLEPVAARSREGRSDVPLARVHMLLATSYLEAGDVARAAEVADLGLEAAREHGWLADPDVARLAATSVWAYLERGDAMYAALRAQDYLVELGEDGDLSARGAVLWNEALARNARGQSRLAMGLIERATALLSEGRQGRDLRRASMAKAWLTMRSPEPDVPQAKRALNSIYPALATTGSPVDAATCEIELARCHLFEGDAGQALMLAERAIERLGTEPRLLRADACSVRAQALIAAGRGNEAAEVLDEARRHLLDVPLNRSSAHAWAQLAHALGAIGADREAVQAAVSAMSAVGLRTQWDAWAGQPGRQPTPPPHRTSC